VHDELALRVNGRLLWFLHHGKKRGAGANEGNAYRNWMRDVFIDSKKFGFVPPDMIISGHTHTPTYTVHVSSDGDGFHVTHGIICPSWQAKTRYAYMVGGVEVNEIGAVFIEITAEGDIRQPKMLKMETGRKKATEA
jgi:predicted phosphodiesterase